MEELEKVVKEFEAKLEEAVREKYSRQNSDLSKEHQELFLSTNTILRFNVLNFLKEYWARNNDLERAKKLVHAMFDIKLELFYIGEFDMGLYNATLYLNGYDPNNPSALDMLKKMSLDQNVIVKSRILWERMMNFVSIYIYGEELEASSRKSKKKKFSELIEGTPWVFLKDYWQTLQWFDDHLRTPEVHSGSVLRKYFQNTAEELDNSKLLVLYNVAINMFYPNVLAIAQGQSPPYKTWAIGMEEPNALNFDKVDKL